MLLPNNIAITEAQSPLDISYARELFREYAAWLGFSLAYQNFDQELAALPGDYASPRGRLLLAHVSDNLAGCAALRPFDRAACEMKRLYVRPGFRGIGLGRHLAEHLIDEARSAGYSHMRLDTIAGKMPSAIALYRTLGFQEIPAYYAGARPGTLYFELRLKS
ncbi:MAG: GNAT family N-acetyltransferase [Candidatus Acidiferrales bacterium]